MFKVLPLAVMILSCQYLSFSQSASTLLGARSAGMGYCSSSLADEWSVFNNVAGLAKVDAITAAFTYDAQPALKYFNKAAATFTLPVPVGVAGLGVYRFGDDLYNEQVLTAGYSNTFGLASLGVKVNVIQYNIKGFGSKSVLTVCFGGIAELTKHLQIGAHIINMNQPKLSSIDGERVPTILVVGIFAKISENIAVAGEIEKNLDYQAAVKAGIEYKIHKKFFVRSGIRIEPNAAFFGFGFKPARYSIDYSFQYNQDSASRHQASVMYKLRAKKK